MSAASRGRAACVAAGVLAAAAAACTEVGTDPKSIVSFLQDTTVVPSLFFGDTLRDSLGNAFDLGRLGRAYNAAGDQIPDAPYTVFVTTADTIAANGGGRDPAAHAVSDGTASGAQYLVADATSPATTPAVSVTAQFAPGLRVTRRFEIIPRPLVATIDTATTDSVQLDTSGTSRTAVFAVRVFADAQATQPVRAHLVRFVLPDSNYAQGPVAGVTFVEGGVTNARRDMRIDTTDATGVASRSLTILQLHGAPSDVVASLTLQAHVLVGQPLRDTTLVITVPVQRVKPATTP